MSEPTVTIVPTGTANMASLRAGLQRSGAKPILASSRADLLAAKAIVLPGVGSFGAAMGSLKQNGFIDLLRDRISQGTPTLAICLGMQLLFEGSEESPGIPGISILPGQFRKFQNGVRSPHVGWNNVEPSKNATVLEAGDFYFTHSYYLDSVPPLSDGAMTSYGVPFVSAVERGNLLACQFHPELSGAFGIDLMCRWLRKESREC